MLERYAARLTLSPINSGSTVYNPQPRGLDLFKPLTAFPFEERQKYGERAVAELSVEHSVPDLKSFVISGTRRGRRFGESCIERDNAILRPLGRSQFKQSPTCSGP